MKLLMILAVLLLTDTVLLARQFRQLARLRAEREQLTLNHMEWIRLKAENDQLHLRQLAPEALTRLRADHAALPRLRTETKKLEEEFGH